jgi:hypothetical protein
MPAKNRANATHRDWGESAVLLVGLALSLSLTSRYTIGGSFMTLTIEIVLAATCALSIIGTLIGLRKATRWGMLVAAGALALSVVVAMTKIVYLVIYHAEIIEGVRLFETALLIWVFNVIVFAVLYHLLGDGDFAFPRAENAAVGPLVFADYLFLSFTTATAFSPTDTPPLRTRARMFMMGEATISLILITLAIVAARAVNIIS